MKIAKSSFLLLATLALGLSACGSNPEPSSSSAPASSSSSAPAQTSSEESSSSSSTTSSSSSEEHRYYTIKWVNYDGTLLETDEKVLEGTVPTYDGEDPTHPNEDHYIYTWAGWDNKVIPAKKNETYTAVFSKKGEEFDITWNNYDGSELLKNKGEYGKLPEYTGTTPTKQGTDLIDYVFKGWSPDPVNVTGAATYTATFDEVNKGEDFKVKLSLPINTMWGLEGEPEVEYEFEYKDAYFFSNNTQRDDDLGLTSLVMSGFNDGVENMNRFFEAIHFTNIYNSPTYETSGYHQIAYSLAKKVIGETTVIAISIRGFQYGVEMVGNFFMGQSGEHSDFRQAMSYVYLGLIEYIAKQITSQTKVKLWINGYSRAAAVANLLGKQLYEKSLNNELGGITKDDIYTYCFETPLCGDAANNGAYPFIHNYINSYDFITHIPPAEYGFKVYGEVVDIYKENVADLLKNFDEKLVFNDFQPYKLMVNLFSMSVEILEDEDSTKDIREYIDTLFDKALMDDITGSFNTLNSRDNYFRYVETHLNFLVNFVFSLTDAQIDALKEKVQGYALNLFMGLIDTESAETLINAVKDLFADCGIDDYVESELASAITDLQGPILNYLLQFTNDMNGICVVNGVLTLVKNINPVILMHLLEPSYVLLKQFIANQQVTE